MRGIDRPCSGLWFFGLLFFIFSLFSDFVSAEENWHRVRNRDADPGIYIMHPDKPSLGMKLAELDSPEAAEAYLRDYLMEAGLGENSKLRLFAVGLPLLKGERREKVREIKEHFGGQGFDVVVRPITHPDGTLEDVLMFFPLAEDFQTPTRGEWISSFVSWALGTTSFSIVMLNTQETNVAIPVIITNATFSASTTFPRQSLGNYFIRTRNYPEKLLKQVALTYIFTLGLMTAKEGSINGVEGLKHALTLGLLAVFTERLGSLLFQVFWRVPVENNIPTWIAQETEKGNERKARAYGSWYRAISTNIATPAWGYSVINNKHFFGGAYGAWNWGHVVMAAVAGVHALAKHFPAIYTAPMNASEWLIQSTGRFLEKPYRASVKTCKLTLSVLGLSRQRPSGS